MIITYPIFNFKITQLLLASLFFLATSYIIYSIFFAPSNLPQVLTTDHKVIEVSDFSFNEDSLVKDNFVDIRKRDIFNLSASVETSAGIQQVITGELPGTMKVVGIVLGRAPQVVVEDTSAMHTYFISEGKPDGGITLVEVQKDKIIINYQGQNISVPVKTGIGSK